jgi:hypothetical protein
MLLGAKVCLKLERLHSVCNAIRINKFSKGNFNILYEDRAFINLRDHNLQNKRPSHQAVSLHVIWFLLPLQISNEIVY